MNNGQPPRAEVRYQLQLKVAALNQSNSPVYRDNPAVESFRPGVSLSDEAKWNRPVASNGYDAQQEEDFRRNREESLQLCDAFHTFYAANAAYHLEF